MHDLRSIPIRYFRPANSSLLDQPKRPSPLDAPPGPFLPGYKPLRRRNFHADPVAGTLNLYDSMWRPLQSLWTIMIEPELIEQCRRGERAARREVYLRTSPRVFRILRRIAANHDDAQDFMQQTYVRAFTSIAAFDGRSSLETWLCRIAINEALCHRRRRVLERREISARADYARRDAPEANLDRAFDVRDALARMDPEDRTILVLRYQEGLDYRTIAEILECPPGTVASRLNRARARLKEFLAAYAPAEESCPPVHPTERTDFASDRGPRAALDRQGRPEPLT
jgi:RNA polymerase sigma-70 factor (ECF subfamily)